MHPLLNSPRRASFSRPAQPPLAPSSGASRAGLVAEHVQRSQRTSADADERQRRSMSPRVTASPGYYLPPPGYLDAADSSRPARIGRDGRSSSPAFGPVNYGGQGSWHQTKAGWTWIPSNGDIGKNPAARWVEENLMPVLSHHDWSIPQAKQILSHWATLATLLAGTQATLLGYYSKAPLEGPGLDFVFACSGAGLFLEVYGALMAAGTIVASISLQAPHATAACHHPAKKPLSARSTAILDRMTVACGYIIPLGAMFQLIGLGTYAAKFQSASVAISMLVSLVFCILVTLLAALLGWRAGTEREDVLQESRRRAQYWDGGGGGSSNRRKRGEEGEDEEEGTGLIGSNL